MSIQQISVILTVVILNSFAQIFLKISSTNSIMNVDRPIWADIWLFLGLGTYASSMILWIKILKYVPLSMAAPFSGFAFIFVPLLCAIFLNERITPQYFIGSILIVLGILIISKS
jgi:drug/metabolite transporter (DMT)-like permease